MPIADLTTPGHYPFVYSGTTPATANTCQIVTLPVRAGVAIVVHNRDKASKTLRISFSPSLTDGGAAPSTWFTVHDPQAIPLEGIAESGFVPTTQLALFSDSSSVNFEILLRPV